MILARWLVLSSVVLLALVSSVLKGQELKPRVLWQLELKAPSFGGAAIADVDADGKLEVAFGTYFGDSSLHVLNGEDGSTLWRHDAGRACLDASPRLANIQGDGRLELVVPISNRGEVIAFDAGTGKKIWTYETTPIEGTDSPPAIVDVDADGKMEVVHGTFKGRLHVTKADEGVSSRVLDVAKGAIQSGPLVIDCNRDGVLDYVCATFKGDNRVYAVDGSSGRELWHFQAADHMYHGCSAGDLDGDQVPELTIADYAGKVYALRAMDGKKLWEVSPGDSYFMSPTVIADVNGDGSPEVIIAGERITAISAGGEVLWSVALEGATPRNWGSITRGVSIADLDGDGGLDVVALYGSGLLRVLRGSDGRSLYEFDASSLTKNALTTSSHGPAIADLDGDGYLDVFFVVGGVRPVSHGLAVAVTGFSGKGRGWYMLRHDARNTGNHNTPLSAELQKHIPGASLGGKTQAPSDATPQLKSATGTNEGVTQEPVDPPATLLARGRKAFYETQEVALAVKLYRQALVHKDATSFHKREAGFYLAGALGRQNRPADALAQGERWLVSNPDDSRRAYVKFFQGVYHQQLGNLSEAHGVWNKLVSEHPDSEIAQAARIQLGLSSLPASPAQKTNSEPRRPSLLSGTLPGTTSRVGGYLVVQVALKKGKQRDAEFARIAQDIAKYHEGTLYDFDGASFGQLATVLKQTSPRHVLFVLAPESLDINFHRRVLLLSAGIDKDIFSDFGFGYFTAENATQLDAFWRRTRKAHKQRKDPGTWVSTAVSNRSQVIPGYIPAIAMAAGYGGKALFWSTIESDADAVEFMTRHMKELEEANVIGMTGNGDPQGVWLFSDRRNGDRSKHWEYDPEKVGQFKDEMPRIMASRFAALELNSPVIWSGTCHCAATNRVFVEGDIVSTFGRTDRATVHVLKPSNSMCLAMIKAGALAFLAPIAANHGASTSMEQDFAFIHGANLGETIKSTYDDIFLAAEGKLVLDFQEEGKRHRSREAVMQGGGSNRILIGDPALAPFTKVAHPNEKITIMKGPKGGFNVVVEWKEGYHARHWDIYGTNRSADARVKTRISLDGLVPDNTQLVFSSTVKATNDAGEAFPYALTHCEPEVFHGRRYLHLQANAPRNVAMGKGVRVVFSVTYR